MVKGTGLTEKRLTALAQAAAPDGLDWDHGDNVQSRILNWLYERGLIILGFRNGERVYRATEAGRAALAERGGAE